MSLSPASLPKNGNGGYYQPGATYNLSKKLDVFDAYSILSLKTHPNRPKVRDVASLAKVSHQYAYKVMKEVDKYGGVIDPEDLKAAKKNKSENFFGVGCRTLSVAHESYLLSLHASNPARPLSDYVSELFLKFGISVSKSLISDWWLRRFEYRGAFRKVNKVPKDKFKQRNVDRYWQFMATRNEITNPFIWNFIDEKHFLNGDCVPDRLRVNPIDGSLAYIPVSGNFREAHNMMCCISTNPYKDRPIAYTLGEFNGDSSAFVTYVQWLIQIGQIRHNEVIVMDNARIHNGGEATIIEDLLWDLVVDERPLNAYILWLPTRTPELNPIELVFHIIAKDIKDWKNFDRVSSQMLIGEVAKSCAKISYDTIMKCCGHVVIMASKCTSWPKLPLRHKS